MGIYTEAAWDDSDLELAIQNPHIKECKVCSPQAKTPCKLSSSFCPYRDIDTLS